MKRKFVTRKRKGHLRAETIISDTMLADIKIDTPECINRFINAPNVTIVSTGKVLYCKNPRSWILEITKPFREIIQLAHVKGRCPDIKSIFLEKINSWIDRRARGRN